MSCPRSRLHSVEVLRRLRRSSSRSSLLSDFKSRRGQAKRIFSDALSSVFLRTRYYSTCTYECILPRESLRSRGEHRNVPRRSDPFAGWKGDNLRARPAWRSANVLAREPLPLLHPLCHDVNYARAAFC